MGKENDVKVAALLGTAQHAINQVKAGVDILVVSGTEAGGHCGSVSTMVLIQRFMKQFNLTVMYLSLAGE